MRHTRRNSKGVSALPVLSACAGQTGFTLGQVAVEAKSKEITAIPQLSELLDLRQKIVTLDARGCQKEIARTIVAGEGDFIFSVKDNRPTLHHELQAAFTAAEKRPTARQYLYTTEDQVHGRHEYRIVQVLPAARYLSASHLAPWLGLLTLVMVVRVVTCQATGVMTTEVSYFIRRAAFFPRTHLPSSPRGRCVRGKKAAHTTGLSLTVGT
jgi:predicted transposase YbfD/YdcC